jgi:hypothetical protein
MDTNLCTKKFGSNQFVTEMPSTPGKPLEPGPSGLALLLVRYRRSAPNLSHKISQVIFCVTRFAKPSLQQPFDPLLCGGLCHRSNARVPPGFDFNVGRQAGNVDQALGMSECLFVERGDPGGKCVNKPI